MNENHRLIELTETFQKILIQIPELTFIGDKILRNATKEVGLEEGREIGEKIKIVLTKYRDIAKIGRGLAAPQIGVNKSVFVTFVDEKFKVYINPRIKNQSDKYNLYREYCLSCGSISADVKRPQSIIIQYLNDLGEMVEDEAEGFSARLLQHEHDHLLGILNIDKSESGTIEFMLGDPLKEELRDA